MDFCVTSEALPGTSKASLIQIVDQIAPPRATIPGVENPQFLPLSCLSAYATSQPSRVAPLERPAHAQEQMFAYRDTNCLKGRTIQV
jgi:hypothetical protein